MEGKVAVLGSADFVMPFTAIGLETFVVAEDTESIQETARKLLRGQYALIVVSETIAEITDKVFKEVYNETLPCIVPMPFTEKSTGFATRSLGETLRMATGIDIMQNT